MLTGPYDRVASNSLAKRVLGWEPKVVFVDRLHWTVGWYFGTKNQDEVSSKLEFALTEIGRKGLQRDNSEVDSFPEVFLVQLLEFPC